MVVVVENEVVDWKVVDVVDKLPTRFVPEVTAAAVVEFVEFVHGAVVDSVDAVDVVFGVVAVAVAVMVAVAGVVETVVAAGFEADRAVESSSVPSIKAVRMAADFVVEGIPLVRWISLPLSPRPPAVFPRTISETFLSSPYKSHQDD